LRQEIVQADVPSRWNDRPVRGQHLPVGRGRPVDQPPEPEVAELQLEVLRAHIDPDRLFQRRPACPEVRLSGQPAEQQVLEGIQLDEDARQRGRLEHDVG
jgi:hypothetical protein